MKKRHCIGRVGLGLLAMLALSLTILPARAQAAVNCAADPALLAQTDTDGDGLTDLEECTGLTLAAGTANAVAFPRWDGTPATRATSLDPNSKDFFVIMVL